MRERFISCMSKGLTEMPNSRNKRRPDGGLSLYSLPTSYVAVDTETTGLDFDYCDLIEIAAGRVINNEVVDTFDTLVHVDYELDPFITALTGITDQMLDGAPSIDTAIKNFSDFAGDAILLAHNASFDMNFLYRAYEQFLGIPLRNDYIDTLRVARRALPELKHHRLPDLCQTLGVDNAREHRGYGDVAATVECYGKMRLRIFDRYGDEEGYRQSFKSHSKKLRASDIVSANNVVDEDTPLYGMRCVFTGKMTSMVRRDAMQALTDVGGIPEDSVKKDTDYLVVGNDGFRDALKTTSGKIQKAKTNQIKGLPIQIISENAFLSLLGKGEN